MILLSGLAIVLTAIGYPITKAILFKYQLVSQNYAGRIIPLGYGVLLGINTIIILIVGNLLKIYSFDLTISFISLIIVVGGVGVIDDYYGTDENKGIKEHVESFIYETKVTSGLLKAVLISIVALIIIIKKGTNLLLLPVDFLLIVLLANFINLLDLRPGRALKGFITIAFLSLAVTNFFIYRLLTPLLLMVFILLPIDLKAKAMLGDAGANLLGAFLGLSLVFALNSVPKLVSVGLLIGVHLYTEKFSLTKLIAQNRLLNYIDNLGRTKI